MRLTEKEFELLKTESDPHEITLLRNKLFVRCGTVGVTFFKRAKHEFVVIAHVNNYRDLDLKKVNETLKN
jgi:hypothetical protein